MKSDDMRSRMSKMWGIVRRIHDLRWRMMTILEEIKYIYLMGDLIYSRHSNHLTGLRWAPQMPSPNKNAPSRNKVYYKDKEIITEVVHRRVVKFVVKVLFAK